jgi:integrase/recombinase XerD
LTHALENINVENLYAIMLKIDDNYKDDAKLFVQFLQDEGYGITFTGLKAYAEYLQAERGGKRLSASTYNKRILGAKNRLKYLFKKSPESFDVLMKYKFEEKLKEIKLKKINSNAVSEDEILSKEEIEKLIEESEDKTIIPMMEFLYFTGVRISEMLGILLSDLKKGRGKYNITIRGKGNKERVVFASKDLIKRIQNQFQGSIYLFEHTRKPYQRNSITGRIKIQGKIILRKSISAHTFRHSFATHKLQETNNLKGVSKYLGHSSTAITADLYVHDELSWDDINGDR